jgi:hypothetical protein
VVDCSLHCGSNGLGRDRSDKVRSEEKKWRSCQ